MIGSGSWAVFVVTVLTVHHISVDMFRNQQLQGGGRHTHRACSNYSTFCRWQITLIFVLIIFKFVQSVQLLPFSVNHSRSRCSKLYFYWFKFLFAICNGSLIPCTAVVWKLARHGRCTCYMTKSILRCLSNTSLKVSSKEMVFGQNEFKSSLQLYLELRDWHIRNRCIVHITLRWKQFSTSSRVMIPRFDMHSTVYSTSCVRDNISERILKKFYS